MPDTPMIMVSSNDLIHPGLASLGTLPRLRQHTCRNCGFNGHVYKTCKQPTLSFGLICYRVGTDGVPQYLMIQRKDSLSFMEFIRGKYELSDLEYLQKMFSTMTQEERRMIQTSEFAALWAYTWCQTTVPRSHEFLECKRKFDTLRLGHTHEGKTIDLTGILRNSKSNYTEPEWGFPKGRRKVQETDLDCAVREFCEETGCEIGDFHVLVTNPYRETFLGTNRIPYSHVYYLASMQQHPSKEPAVDRTNIQQIREVRSIGWFTADEVMERIREHNWERKNIFQLAHKKVCELLEHEQQIGTHGEAGVGSGAGGGNVTA